MTMTMTPLDGGLQPVGAYQRVRALGLTTAPATPHASGHGAGAEVCAMAWIDIVVADAGIHLGAMMSQVFAPRSAVRQPGRPPPSTPVMLRQALWAPMPPDVLVAHDVALARTLLPEAVTGPLPWTGLGRIARQVFVDVPDVTSEAMARWLGLPPPAAARQGGATLSMAERQAALAAGLLLHLLRDEAVQQELALAHRHADRLRPIFGPMLGHAGVQALVSLTSAITQPVGDPPAAGDAAGWAACPADDLRWWAAYAGFDGNAIAPAAAELDRRRRAGMPEQPPQSAPRLLLRRGSVLPHG